MSEATDEEASGAVEGTPETEVDPTSAAATELEGVEVVVGIEESVEAVELREGADVDSISAAATALDPIACEVITTEEEVAKGVEESVAAVELATVVVSISASTTALEETTDPELERSEEAVAEGADVSIVAVELRAGEAVDSMSAAERELEEATGVEIKVEVETSEEPAPFVSSAATALGEVSVAVILVVVPVASLVPVTTEELATTPVGLASRLICWGATSGVAGVNTSVTFWVLVDEVEFDGVAGAVELSSLALARRDVMLATFSPTGVSGSWLVTGA